jgi:hypothetical protein
LKDAAKRAIAAVVLLAILIPVTYAIVVHVRGRIHGEPADDLRRRLDQLRSVPYTMTTSDQAAPDKVGVVIYDPERAYPGYNIYTMLESYRACLSDMEGKIVKTWSYGSDEDKRWDWENAVMLDNGDVLIIEKYGYLLRLDWNGNLIWRHAVVVHHEVTPLADGTFYCIAREVKSYRGLKVRFPAIVHLSQDGTELSRWSSFDHLGEIKKAFDTSSFLDTFLDKLLQHGDSAEVYAGLSKNPDVAPLKPGTRYYDYFHMNTITVLPETDLGRRDPRFEPGNLLICFRNVNQIAVLKRDTKEELQWPHDPTMLSNGNILVLDNGVVRRSSRVLEINPVSLKIEWEYKSDPPSRFYSRTRGSAQRLPNGNTLICEGDVGRAFEVTRDGEIVWEWWNPDIKDGRRVQVYRMVRLDAAMVDPLLKRQ